MKRIFIYKNKKTHKIVRVDFHKAHANDSLAVILNDYCYKIKEEQKEVK